MKKQDDHAAKGKGSKQQQDAVAGLQQQIDELTEALKRERADAINLRRRYEEQIASMQTMAKAGVVRDLLPIIDNFERALKHVPKDLEQNDYVKGIQAIVRQFEQTLEKLGVQRIKTVGELFNPHLHDAVSMEEGDGEHEIVSEELQSGYTLGDEVLRPAMVRVKNQ